MVKEKDETISFINEGSPYQEKTVKNERTTMSVPEIAWQLGITRKEVYSFIYAAKNDGIFRFVTVADRKRITRDSYLRWLHGQDKYHILTQAERDAREREQAKASENAPRKPKNPNFYTIEEITYFFGIHRSTIYKWIRESMIPARRIGTVWRIPREEFEDWMDYRGC